MGDLFGDTNQNPDSTLAGERDRAEAPPEGKVKTDFEGVYADAINPKDNLPVFTVSHNEFYQNMANNRNRIRFKSGSDVQKYMQNGKYKTNFWIQHETEGYMRKVR